ncbi:MAG: hypothetical protein KC502_23360 [Myxococcales bacterium]|nr:hypothetical protein [Myxococcales bacterium]
MNRAPTPLHSQATRHLGHFSWTSVLAVALLAAFATGCGGDDEPDKTDKTDVATDAGASDTGAADTGSATTDTGSTKSDTGSTPKDTGPAPKTSCGAALLCQTQCGKGDTKCTDTCADNVSAADKTALGDIATCAVDLCKDVTEGTAAEQECAFDKCYDKYKGCAEFGAGEGDCTSTVACLASCTLTDFACRLSCMQSADKGAIASAKAVAACVSTECKGIADAGKLAACVSAKCSKAIGTCLDGSSFGCTDVNLWISKCEKSSKLEPNNCVGIVKGMADEDSGKAYDAYETCKTQCKQAVNVIGCWSDKCTAEAKKCFSTSGAKNCQDIDKCVNSKCDGIGGGIDCIKGCLPESKAASQDAYLSYEGCMVRNMNSKEAKTAKCKFPYDQAKCVPIIKGQFCGNEAQNCFTDQ